MGQTDSLRIKALEAQRAADAAELQVEQKEQLILALFQQRQQLRAELARTGAFEAATAINELGDRIVMLNGQHAQEMAIDTGASVIALPWGVAKAAGLTPTDRDRTIHVQVANGRIVEAKRVIAKTVRVGKFTAENVECTVLPPELPDADPLLGLSFLKKFSFKIDAGRGKLILSQIGTGNPKR